MRNITKIIFFIFCSFTVFNTYAQKTYTNPLLPSGADPWVTYKDGYYYYTNTTGHNITLWKTKNIVDLKSAERKIVWTPPASGSYSKQIWAPEIHFLQGKWYAYFAADSGNNFDHRMYVIENTSRDPLEGTWKMKGQLNLPENKWAIDASVFENNGKMFVIWSGWQGNENGEQDIFIAQLKNPWTVEGKRTLISAPTLSWETHGDLNNPNDVPHVNVNEGPEILKHGDKIFLTYSASGCWTDYYALGMLTAGVHENLLNASSWKKSAQPVFKQSPENHVYATGHNSFFKSPDGTEDYILYHANSEPGQGCGSHRSPRAQKFTWKEDGTPDFGEPVAEGFHLNVPSGTDDVASLKENPVLNMNFPDPTVINVDGTYYAYATQGRSEGNTNHVQVASSKDLFHWKYLGDALPEKPSWASYNFWAPDVLFDTASQQYVMFFSAKNKDTSLNMCIGVAFSKTPQGPFVDMGAPLLKGKDFSNIDPMVMIDPKSGKKILYWGSDFAPIRVQELNEDWKSFKNGSEAKAILFPDKNKDYEKLIEGAWVDYNEGKYYLYYSGDNCCGDRANYAVMIARADNPFGPFETPGKYDGAGNSVILAKDSDWFAPGHNSIVKDVKGNLWIAYHAIWPNEAAFARKEAKDRYVRRVMCIQPVKYINGWPVVEKKY
jgi:GH43 family beta-xylosidase